MIGMTYSSLPLGAGHIMTLRDHVCGEFKDDAIIESATKEQQ
ncbi:hypothetical protein [Herminiimonas sp. CN]|nr:hypothetical protein [Herminiimonas sp. CN]